MRRSRAKTLRLAAVTAASAAVTAACGISNASTTAGLAAGPSGTPITVGISQPLSGPLQAQGFEADGQACLKGYELWASTVNSHGGLLGHPVKLVVMNDEGWPASTKYDYKWLITHDHVNLTLGPFSSLLTAQAAAPVTEQYGYALAAGQAGSPAVYSLHDPDLFSTNVPVVNQMVPFADWVKSLPPSERPRTAAYPSVANPFSGPPVVEAMKILSAAGIKTVYKSVGGFAQQGVNYGIPNEKPAALKAEARAVVHSGAQMVLIGSVDIPTVQAFVKDFIAQHYTPKLIIAASGPDQGNQFLGAIGTGNAYGIMVPDGWYGAYPNALSHVMVQDYIAKYGGAASDINADVAESYSAAQTLQAAVEATGGTVQSKLISWLHKNTVQTVLGPVSFSAVGENTKESAVIFQWQPGPGGTPQFVQVLPTKSAASVTPIFKSPWTG
jgi:branched-chain amino acid transport system substrate-binding protein